jgi:hypothetical protein
MRWAGGGAPRGANNEKLGSQQLGPLGGPFLHWTAQKAHCQAEPLPLAWHVHPTV